MEAGIQNPNWKKYENASMSKVEVKCHQLPNTSSIHDGANSYQVTPISDQ